jgi:hypothetical protein
MATANTPSLNDSSLDRSTAAMLSRRLPGYPCAFPRNRTAAYGMSVASRARETGGYLIAERAMPFLNEPGNTNHRAGHTAEPVRYD